MKKDTNLLFKKDYSVKPDAENVRLKTESHDNGFSLNKFLDSKKRIWELDFLRGICNDNNIDYSTETVLELYEKITSNGIEVPIDITRPLANFDTVLTILIPTKLSVLSSLQGGL